MSTPTVCCIRHVEQLGASLALSFAPTMSECVFDMGKGPPKLLASDETGSRAQLRKEMQRMQDRCERLGALVAGLGRPQEAEQKGCHKHDRQHLSAKNEVRAEAARQSGGRHMWGVVWLSYFWGRGRFRSKLSFSRSRTLFGVALCVLSVCAINLRVR